MSEPIARFPRLPYDLMEYALRLKSAPAAWEMDAACREAWEQFQLDHPETTGISSDDFRRAFEVTLQRYTALLTRPAA